MQPSKRAQRSCEADRSREKISTDLIPPPSSPLPAPPWIPRGHNQCFSRCLDDPPQVQRRHATPSSAEDRPWSGTPHKPHRGWSLSRLVGKGSEPENYHLWQAIQKSFLDIFFSSKFLKKTF